NQDDSDFANSMSDFEEDDIFPETQPKKTYKTEYQVLSPNNLKAKQDGEISQVSTILGLSNQDSATLLRHFRWNKERLFEQYMDSPEKVIKQSGLSLSQQRQQQQQQENDFICDICCDQVDQSIGLSCDHRFCQACYKQYVQQKIGEGESRRIECPESDCQLIVDQKTVELLMDAVGLKKYRELLNRTFVDDHDFLKWCPAPDCEYAIECAVPSTSLVSFVPTVRCECQHRFCFGCTLNDHQPCICSLVSKWLKKCADDSETANWISANTKECGKCHSTIEKNGGCNHMTCRKCKHEFCWVCMGPWSEHGTSWYTCNRFDENSSEQTQNNQTRSRMSLERYLHYYNRFANHEHSAKLDQELYQNTEKKMEEIQKTSDLSWIEDNQRDLEMATEQLSELLEKPLDSDPEKIAKLRQAVLDKTVYVKSRREILLEDTAKGLQEGRWSFFVDL
ncbi:hypothetical protein CU098_002904, partial [Rhizopus stolonifer]